MTAESELFRTRPAKGALPLYEGKMIWQFDGRYAAPRYWINEKRGRRALLKRAADDGQRLDYQQERLAVRAVAANTNERSLIATLLPGGVFCGNSLLTNRGPLQRKDGLYLVAVLNSFVLDWYLRRATTANVNCST